LFLLDFYKSSFLHIFDRPYFHGRIMT